MSFGNLIILTPRRALPPVVSRSVQTIGRSVIATASQQVCHRVCHLSELNPPPNVKALKHAVHRGLEIDAISCDAIRLILEYQQEEPIALFSLDGRPHLKLVRVAQTDVSVYQSLLMEGATL
jgi:hypothetical protein